MGAWSDAGDGSAQGKTTLKGSHISTTTKTNRPSVDPTKVASANARLTSFNLDFGEGGAESYSLRQAALLCY